MAFCACIPFFIVCAREDWEELCIMLSELSFVANRMAAEALGAVIGIAAHAAMRAVHLVFSVLMTVET